MLTYWGVFLAITVSTGVLGEAPHHQTIVSDFFKNLIYNSKAQQSAAQDEFFLYLKSHLPYYDIVLPVAGILVFALFMYLAVSQKKHFMIQNLMTEEEFHDKQHTIKAVSELMRSKEYVELRSRKGTDVKNWNWQSRAKHTEDGGLKWTEPSSVIEDEEDGAVVEE
eukprot:Platyproteum_vivax@DN3542_c0_g1_i1.p1